MMNSTQQCPPRMEGVDCWSGGAHCPPSAIGVDLHGVFNFGRDAPADRRKEVFAGAPIVGMQNNGSPGAFPSMALKSLVPSPAVYDQPLFSAGSINNQNPDINRHMKTQQIDGAIRLLQRQYNAIMSAVALQGCTPASQRPLDNSFPAPRIDVPMQKAFTSQFELPTGQAVRYTHHASESNSCSAHRKRVGNEVDTERMCKKATTFSPGKVVLDSETACAIYEKRPKVWDRRGGKAQSQSASIAAEHGVTAKTIRDIWNRSTWARATRHLWTADEVGQYLEQRRRMSARLDPSRGLPNWCGADGAEADGDCGAGADAAAEEAPAPCAAAPS